MTYTSSLKSNKEPSTCVDDETDFQEAARLEQSPHSGEKAHQQACLQSYLTAQLYRVTCPSSFELGEYHLNVLPQEQAAAVARHLEKCPHCTREVAQLNDYLNEFSLKPTPLEQVKERVKERVRVLVADLVSHVPGSPGGQPTLMPAGVAVRGADDGPSIYAADDVQVAVEIQDDAERPGRKAILGLVIGAKSDGLKAHLWRVEQPVAIVPVDELGNFVFPNLPRGDYELILSGPEVEIRIQKLEIGVTTQPTPKSQGVEQIERGQSKQTTQESDDLVANLTVLQDDE